MLTGNIIIPTYYCTSHKLLNNNIVSLSNLTDADSLKRIVVVTRTKIAKKATSNILRDAIYWC